VRVVECRVVLVAGYRVKEILFISYPDGVHDLAMLGLATYYFNLYIAQFFNNNNILILLFV
jgi:hypothetical protein